MNDHEMLETVLKSINMFSSSDLHINKVIDDLKLEKIITMLDRYDDSKGKCYFCQTETNYKHLLDNKFVCEDCAIKHRRYEIQGPPFTVNLTYFKLSGKFYCSGSYETEYVNIIDIHDECINKLKTGNWPGLFDGKHDFNTLIEIENHPMNFPRMIMLNNL